MQQWQDKYLAPRIGKEKITFKKVKLIIIDFFTLLVHSVSPHEFPKEPPEKLPRIKSDNQNEVYSICKDMYNNSNQRIDSLEDKAIKLVSFITILFTIISFTFLNIASNGIRYILIVSMVLLMLAILIAFRCVNIKYRQTMFLPSIYYFEGYDTPLEDFNLKNQSEKLLQAAVFNQNVADNTADILKSTRNLLFLSICLVVIAFLIGAFSYEREAKSSAVKSENSSSVNSLEQEIKSFTGTLETINDNLIKINDLNNSKINELTKRLNESEEKSNNLSIKINEIEKRMDNKKSDH